MDRILNPKKDTDSIYEIYRACRLCGGGAGYKMPIIQSIVEVDESDVELKQKIRECVQIEVHQDDKMPPLICELCVDKVNDFYEFLDMVRQTNKRTRLRLGLPLQLTTRGAAEAGDCILGVTERVFQNEESDGEPMTKQKKITKNKIRKEPMVRIKVENLEEKERLSRKRSLDEERVTRQRKREPTPPRLSRKCKVKEDDIALSSLSEKSSRCTRSKEDEMTLSSLKDKNNSPKVTPKPILKRENSIKSEDSLPGKLKRTRDKKYDSEVKRMEPAKKVRITTKPSTPTSPKSSPKSSRLQPQSRPQRSPVVTPPKSSISPVKEQFPCDICGFQSKSVQARTCHMRSHTVGFTNSKLACNPCGEWFLTFEGLTSHQKKHKSKNIPFPCRGCYTDFKKLADYEDHIKDKECVPYIEVPDVKCDECWQMFPTNNLLDNHKCPGKDQRPGGICSKCSKTYSLLKNLKKHESTCRKKGEPIIDKEVRDKLLPMQVRISRCDTLLNGKEKHCDVSNVSGEYGLDRGCFYPYISRLRFTSIIDDYSPSRFKGMVKIHNDITKAFRAEDYVHWDSEYSDTDDESSCNILGKRKSIPSLTALTLKTIFSHRLLGKVPRKRRTLKPKVFDTGIDDHEDVKIDIDSIISNLGDHNDDSVSDNKDIKQNNVDDISVSDKDIKQNNLDDVNDSVNDNVVNDNISETDVIRYDSPIVSTIIEDIKKNIDSVSNRDDVSIESLDLLKGMQNNFDENNDNGIEKAVNDNHINNLDNAKTDDISKAENDSNLVCDSDANIDKAKINDTYSIDSILKTRNNDSGISNDLLDDTKESNINNINNGKVSNNDIVSNENNDKVSNNDIVSNVYNDKISNSDIKIGLGSIDNFSFNT